ncbi:MAG: SIS domain-containing protein [Alphaproteobacteria bacterium]|nr:SIS domain-containing protein [Alphaproteobacteria bacterium]
MESGLFSRYFDSLHTVAKSLEASGADGGPLSLAEAGAWVISAARATHDAGNKLMFIGNGGSAGIASHLSIDYSKNGNMRSLTFNDPSSLTCLGNDLGYENVFTKQVEIHAVKGDLLVAISSSGRSPNILGAAKLARSMGCRVVTLSGFTPDNPLRSMGDINVYVASNQYGLVEIMHQTVLHAVLDIAMGWRGEIMAG